MASNSNAITFIVTILCEDLLIKTTRSFQSVCLVCLASFCISHFFGIFFFLGCFYFDRQEKPCVCVEIDSMSARMNR